MTQPQDPRNHPLQDDEVALARVLRALPAGEPPASVDAAILRAATDAVSPGRRKPARGLRWLPTWAIGTAAAAVLAVGIGLQLRPPLVPEYPAASVEEKAVVRPGARERLSVDLIEPDQSPAPPPASAPPEPRRSSSSRPSPPPPPPPPPPAPVAPAAPAVEFVPEPQAGLAEAAAPAPADEPAPETDRQLDTVEVTGSRLRSEATDQARRAHQESYARRAQAKADESARSAAASANAAPVAGAAMSEAESAPAAAAAPAAFSDAPSGEAVLPPVADDAQLSPADWFDRIRERRRQGDLAGARASLRLFLQVHPEAPLPSDLARLR